jgi:hypothetical protein
LNRHFFHEYPHTARPRRIVPKLATRPAPVHANTDSVAPTFRTRLKIEYRVISSSSFYVSRIE